MTPHGGFTGSDRAEVTKQNAAQEFCADCGLKREAMLHQPCELHNTGEDACHTFVPPDLTVFTHYEITSHLHFVALAKKSYPDEYRVAKRIVAALDPGCDGSCKQIGRCTRDE